MSSGFDNDMYLRTQSEHIRERIKSSGGKLYLEFGGKLFDDYHASRVLPGFKPDSKISMLSEFGKQAEAIVVINAEDIVRNKVRKDIGIGYDMEVLRLVDSFTDRGIDVCGLVITHYSGQSAVDQFQKKVEALGLRIYRHYYIEGYPTNIPYITSDDGFGKNDYVETTKPLVVVTAPGPGSGKMAVCLSQLYHEHVRGVSAGYAKFETFPVWNLPLNHPVNIAYEAATADLSDSNMIDPFHLEAYGKTAVNYNRDVEIFPVLNAMFQRINGESPYRSPTDMGVNMAGYAIFDDEACCEASRQEIIRRYYSACCTVRQGLSDGNDVRKLELIMSSLGISSEQRPSVAASLAVAERTAAPAVAIELADGTMITGKTSSLLGASSAALLNALKALAGIDDAIHLISPTVIEPIQKLKVDHMGNHNPRLHTDEVLIALSICAVTDENAAAAMKQLEKLKGCEAHSTVILSRVDENVFHKLGVNITCEPQYQTKKLYHA